ncbi:MAG: hypothetical protein FWH42_05350 [Dehalococcoidia bacterium]|nr:hypothetical protein [Dehalococcoidia bacterium]
MKKISIGLLFSFIFVITIGIYGNSCVAPKPNFASGGVEYRLNSVEENDIDVSMDSIDFFNLVLYNDNTYSASFRATGMPAYTSEEGTYTTNGSDIVFTKNQGTENLLFEGISYSSDTIKVACFKYGTDNAYSAVFKYYDNITVNADE